MSGVEAWLVTNRRGMMTAFDNEKYAREFVGSVEGISVIHVCPISERDTLRAQLEAAEAELESLRSRLTTAYRVKTECNDEANEQRRLANEAEARAEAAEADAQRWRKWRALDEHAAAEVAWFAGGPEVRDAEIDARTKEETK